MKKIKVERADLCPFHKEMLEGNEWKDICAILFDSEKTGLDFYCSDSWAKDIEFPENCPLSENNILVEREK